MRRFKSFQSALLHNTSTYVNFIQKYRYPKNIAPYRDVITGNNKYRHEIFNMNHLRYIMLSLFFQPQIYAHCGTVKNWFNENAFWENIIMGRSLYNPQHIRDIDMFNIREKNFINKVQNTPIDVFELNVSKYKEFLKDQSLGVGGTPDFETQLLWYGHMLDNHSFMRDIV